MRIPFVDSDIQDLITIMDDDDVEFEVKIEDDEEIYSHGFDKDDEEEPTYEYDDDDFGDGDTNTTTSSTNIVSAPVNHPVDFKKFKKIVYAIGFCTGVLSILWFHMTSIVTPRINVEIASVYPLKFSSVSSALNVAVAYNITAGWNINFAVANPSKEHVLLYSNLVATVNYKGNPTWVTIIPAFEQAEYNLDFVHAIFDRNPIRVENSFAISVLKDIKYGSASDFSVQLDGNIRQKKASDAEKKHSGRALHVFCELDVEFLPKADLMAVATPMMCSTSVGNKDGKKWLFGGY